MSFPRVYSALEQMMHDSLLETGMARAIARKAGIRLGAATSGSLPDLWGQIAHITGGDSSLGYELTSPALSSYVFPDSTPRAARYADSRGVSQVRLLATVTDAASAGARLSIEIQDGVGEPVALSGTLEVPLDAVGLHVSEWRSLVWGETQEERPSYALWRASNPPASATTYAVGLCQLQVR